MHPLLADGCLQTAGPSKIVLHWGRI